MNLIPVKPVTGDLAVSQKVLQGLMDGKYRFGEGKLFNAIIDKQGRIIEKAPLLRSTGNEFIPINSLPPGMQTFALLQGLNLGLSVVNLGATIGLYFFINKKLNELRQELIDRLDRIDSKIDYVIEILHEINKMSEEILRRIDQNRLNEIENTLRAAFALQNSGLHITEQGIVTFEKSYNGLFQLVRDFYSPIRNLHEIVFSGDRGERNASALLQKFYDVVQMMVFVFFMYLRIYLDLDRLESAATYTNEFLKRLQTIQETLKNIPQSIRENSKLREEVIEIEILTSGAIRRSAYVKLEIDLSLYYTGSFKEWEETIRKYKESTPKFVAIGVPKAFQEYPYPNPKVPPLLLL